MEYKESLKLGIITGMIVIITMLSIFSYKYYKVYEVINDPNHFKSSLTQY